MKIEQVIGRNIARAREQQPSQRRPGRPMSQAELADELVKWFGGEPWSRQAVSAAENGGRAFIAVELLALSLALGKPVTWFFRATEDVAMPSGEKVPAEYVLGLFETHPNAHLSHISEAAQDVLDSLEVATKLATNIQTLTGATKRAHTRIRRGLAAGESGQTYQEVAKKGKAS